MSETSTVAVIDRKGERHEYDADGWHEEAGHLFVTKDGENVAVFAPGQGKVDEPASAAAAAVAVIDQHGRHHAFDADDFGPDGPYLFLYKDGKKVARFEPGFIGVYLAHSYKG